MNVLIIKGSPHEKGTTSLLANMRDELSDALKR